MHVHSIPPRSRLHAATGGETMLSTLRDQTYLRIVPINVLCSAGVLNE